MGNRASIYIIDQFNPTLGLFLYTHGDGEYAPETLRKGMIRGKNRWNDAAYLARILFSTFTRGQEDSEFGYALSVTMISPDHPVLAVSTHSQRIDVVDVENMSEDNPPRILNSFTFEEYVAMDLDKDGWKQVSTPRTTVETVEVPKKPSATKAKKKVVASKKTAKTTAKKTARPKR